jgi:hypothetical protein
MRNAHKHRRAGGYERIRSQPGNSLMPPSFRANDRSQYECGYEVCDEVMPGHGATLN